MGRLQFLVVEVYEHKYRAQMSELKQLQSQINPHFLYNSFYSLYRMAKMKELDNIIPFTKYLGEYFRFITRSDQDEILLSDEIKHVETYISIQLIRFPDRFQVKIESLPEEFSSLLVPRLLLQPVIENAFEYALESKMSDGMLLVYFKHEKDLLEIYVEDNGEYLDNEKLNQLNKQLEETNFEDTNTTGLLNVHRRIQLHFGNRSGIRLERSSLGGLKVVLVFELSNGQLVKKE